VSPRNFCCATGTGSPYTICGVATDITDRKRAENEIRRLNVSLEKRVAERTIELARSEEKFRALFEGTSQAVVLHDENGILEANPSWLQLPGLFQSGRCHRQTCRRTLRIDSAWRRAGTGYSESKSTLFVKKVTRVSEGLEYFPGLKLRFQPRLQFESAFLA